jgi:hypothetical protein
MTPLELAKMTKRTELVELDTAGAVGQAPYSQVSDEVCVAHRLSPLAKCPCGNTRLTYYESCRKDTSSPAHLVDATGRSFRMVPARRGLGGKFDPFLRLTTLPARETPKSMTAKYAALLRSDPNAPTKAYAREGLKCRVALGDPEVYAGCLERLADDDDDFFLWTDLTRRRWSAARARGTWPSRSTVAAWDWIARRRRTSWPSTGPIRAPPAAEPAATPSRRNPRSSSAAPVASSSRTAARSASSLTVPRTVRSATSSEPSEGSWNQALVEDTPSRSSGLVLPVPAAVAVPAACFRTRQLLRTILTTSLSKEFAQQVLLSTFLAESSV